MQPTLLPDFENKVAYFSFMLIHIILKVHYTALMSLPPQRFLSPHVGNTDCRTLKVRSNLQGHNIIQISSKSVQRFSVPQETEPNTRTSQESTTRLFGSVECDTRDIVRIISLLPTSDSLNQNVFFDALFFSICTAVHTAKGAFKHHTAQPHSTPVYKNRGSFTTCRHFY